MMFYTYLWLREDGTPYYVGKSASLKRAYGERHKVNCPPKGRIIIQEWLSEESAFEGERFLIAYYGRLDLGTGVLRNMTDGGEGASGFRHIGKRLSASHRLHIGEALQGRKLSENHRCKMIEAQKGTKRSPETCARISDAKKGTHRSEDVKRRLREVMKGRSPWNTGKKLGPRSEEVRKKISRAHTGKLQGPHSAESKEKIRRSNLGKHNKGQPRPVEVIKKMSLALTGKPWSAKRRALFQERQCLAI
jgi:hypothetical protein